MIYTKFLLILIILCIFYNSISVGKRRHRKSTRAARQGNNYSGDETSTAANTYTKRVIRKDNSNEDIETSTAAKTSSATTYTKAVTKKDWVYKKSPRPGVLFIRTDSGKILYPGEINLLRNAITFDDFFEDFHIQFLAAHKDTKYTLVSFARGYLAKAVTNINGEDLYTGLQGDKFGEVFIDVNKQEVEEMLRDSKAEYCIEILEQLPGIQLSALITNRNDWTNSKNQWKNDVAGTAAKTCFIVLPPGQTEIDTKDNDFSLVIEHFEEQMSLYNQATKGIKRSIKKTVVENGDVFSYL